jgi:hypothetical protein
MKLCHRNIVRACTTLLAIGSSFLSVSETSAGLIEVFSPTNPDSGSTLFSDIVQPLPGYYAVEQAKFRGNTTNFNQSLDNGRGTSLIDGKPIVM